MAPRTWMRALRRGRLLFAIACTSVCGQEDPVPLQAYAAVGSTMAQNLRLGDLKLSEKQLEAFLDGMRAAGRGQAYALDADGVRLMELLQRRLMAATAAPADSPRLQRYLDDAKHHFQMQRSPTGLLYRIQDGAGPRPRLEDTVVITYEARAADGRTELPQLSRKSVRVKVADLMPALAEALRMMPLGAYAQLVIPPQLSFGDGAWPAGIEAGSPLVMLVRLEDIVAVSGG